jgi:hypothetical protein
VQPTGLSLVSTYTNIWALICLLLVPSLYGDCDLHLVGRTGGGSEHVRVRRCCGRQLRAYLPPPKPGGGGAVVIVAATDCDWHYCHRRHAVILFFTLLYPA